MFNFVNSNKTIKAVSEFNKSIESRRTHRSVDKTAGKSNINIDYESLKHDLQTFK